MYSLKLSICSMAQRGVLRWIAVSPLLLMSPSLLAAIYDDGGTHVIDTSSAPTEGYSVSNGTTLNANGSTSGAIYAAGGSTLNMTGATVLGATNGVVINSSHGTISRSNISGAVYGLTLNRPLGSTVGSQATVSDSQISGGMMGAQVTALSSLVLNNTAVTGTGSNSRGLVVRNGEVFANGGSIHGVAHGVEMLRDTGLEGTGKLTLNGTAVSSETGAAVVVRDGATAEIELLNGSTLEGGDGNALQVRQGATVGMKVANSLVKGNVDVSGNSTANLTFDGAGMEGDFIVEDGSTGTLGLDNGSVFKGSLTNVSKVAINSASEWIMTANNDVADLALGGGQVTFGDANQFFTLNVENLSGNGTFKMDVDFQSNAHDKLNVTDSATGNFDLAVAGSGVDPLSPQHLNLVHTAAGDAIFALAGGGSVDVGTYSYGLNKTDNLDGSTDWYLDPGQRTISPSTRSVLALFNTAPTVWYGELTSLRTRMGELRFNGGQSGAWARSYGNKYEVAEASGVGYTQTQQGFSLGADAPLPIGDGQWLIGALAGHSNSELDLTRGSSGTVKSYYVGAYTTWIDPETGYYFDGVVKLNNFHSESKVSMSDNTRAKGSYSTTGLGGSAEFGRHIKLDDGYFVEPFAQVAAVVIQAKDYELDNGLKAQGDQTRSLLGKVGVTTGRDFTLDDGTLVQPYLRVGMAHEFAKSNEVQVNNNVFNNDLSGSRVEFGAGAAVSVSKNLQLHADFGYAKGKHIEQPFDVSVGLRYNF